METRGILIVGLILLCGGCAGLSVVRLSHPMLKGLGWLGGAFAAGALGLGLLTLRDRGFWELPMLVPNTCFLLAYVLLQVCLRELLRHRATVPRLGASLLVLQAVALVLLRGTEREVQWSIVLFGLLLGLQALAIVLKLRRAERWGIRAPVRYLMVVLLLFAGFNLVRSGLVLRTGVPRDTRLPNPLEVEAAMVYLATALGVGFGVFWLTSALLRLTLEEQANTDPLTGVANRRAFLELCEREFERCGRSGEVFTLVLLDIDHFKRINDVYGHSIGDVVLCEAVDRMRGSLRSQDVLGRWGGEEFVVLLPGTGTELAQGVAEGLRRSVESLKVANTWGTRGAAGISVTVSVGLAAYTGATRTLDDLFVVCDRALYEAKASGRNRIVCAGEPLETFTETLRSLA